jgi:hypothetical protein
MVSSIGKGELSAIPVIGVLQAAVGPDLGIRKHEVLALVISAVSVRA